MKSKLFLGPDYKLSTVNYDCAELWNLYPEADEMGVGKEQEVLSLVSVPGLTLVHQLPRSPIRGIHQTMNNYIYVAAGNGIYLLTTANGTTWTHTLVANLTTTTGRVYFADGVPNTVNNQSNTARIVKVVVTDGSLTGLCMNENGTNVILLNAGNGYNGSAFCTFQDGFFLFSQPNTPVCQFASDPMNISGLDTIVVNLAGDNISRVLSDHDIVWIFGNKTSSVWQNTGGTGFFNPLNLFNQIPGSMSEGGAFPHTVCKLGGQILWLQNDPNGTSQLFQAVGYRGGRVSTHSLEDALGNIGDLSTATAWAYQIEGHSFYNINVPGLEYTFSYDIIDKMWHKRGYFQNGQFSRDLVEHHYNINLPGIGQFPLCGDYQSGNLYLLDQNNFTHNGQPINRIRTTPHISSEYKRMVWKKLQLDIETGTAQSGQGYPYVQGTTGAPVLQTATQLELLGNGQTSPTGNATYQFQGNDGSVVTPTTPAATIIASLTSNVPYATSVTPTISGNSITFYPGVLQVPLSQFALGDGSTTSFNLTNDSGTNIQNAVVYANDWRGNILQSTSPRTNLVQYSYDFNKAWTGTGVNPNPAPTVANSQTSSAVTTNSSPTINTLEGNQNDVTEQLGWSQNIYTAATTFRPAQENSPDGMTVTTGSSGAPNGSGLTINTATSSPNNYWAGSNTGTIKLQGSALETVASTTVEITTPNSLVLSNFGTGTNISGTLFINLSTTTSCTTPITTNVFQGMGEIDVQYIADQMTTWNTVSYATGSQDFSSTTNGTICINLTVQNLATLKVRILCTAQPALNLISQTNQTGNNIVYAQNFTDNFKVYDCCFQTGFSYPLNAPDGSATGTALVEDSSVGFHYIQSTYNSIAGRSVCYSIYAEPGDPTRYLQMQLGSGNSIVAGATFNLNTTPATLVSGTLVGTGASYQIQSFGSAVPSTGVILVNTLMTQYQSNQLAQIAPTVLQTPTNGDVITYAWSFVSGSGGVIIGSTTGSSIQFNVGAAGNLTLQCIVTVNNVQTIYTQFITVTSAALIYRLSIVGTELLTGTNTATLSLVNPTYPLGYSEQTATYGNQSWFLQGTQPTGATSILPFNIVGPTYVAQSATNIPANLGSAQPTTPNNTFSWSIVGTGSSIVSSYQGQVLFSVGAAGVYTLLCAVTVIGSNTSGGFVIVPAGTYSLTVVALPTLGTFYPGNMGAWVGIWGAQIEESTTIYTAPTPLIETVGSPLTDLYTLNSTTGNIIFGVAPLEDAVLTASFYITAISLAPIQFYASYQYYEALPNIIYIGTEPTVSLSYSIDGGHTFSPPEAVSLGASGSYQTQCIWRRLGRSRDRVFRISCSDPVKFGIIGHSFDLEVAKN